MSAATLKRSIASLVGGIGVAVFVFVLWLLLMDSTSPASVVTGLVLAGLVGGWVRLADL